MTSNILINPKRASLDNPKRLFICLKDFKTLKSSSINFSHETYLIQNYSITPPSTTILSGVAASP